MPRKPQNHKKPITKNIINQVKLLAKQNLTASSIAKRLGRTQASIYGIASNNNIPLTPKQH